MNWFYNLGISKKLITAFSLIAGITAIVGLIGIYNMSRINEMADALYEKELQGLSLIKEANINLIYSARAEKNAILATTKEERDKHLNNINLYDKKFIEFLNKAKPLINTTEGNQAFERLMNAWEDYRPVAKKIVEIIKSERLTVS